MSGSVLDIIGLVLLALAVLATLLAFGVLFLIDDVVELERLWRRLRSRGSGRNR